MEPRGRSTGPYIAREAEQPLLPLGAQWLQLLMVPEDGGSKDVTVGRSHWPPQAAGVPHTHVDWDEMFYVLAGIGELTVDGKKYDLKPGTFVLVRRGQEHAVTDSGPEGLEMLFLLSPAVSAAAILPAPPRK